MASSAASTTCSHLLPHPSLKNPTSAKPPSLYTSVNVHAFPSTNAAVESHRECYSNTLGNSSLERPATEDGARERQSSPRDPFSGTEPTSSPSRTRNMEQRMVSVGPEKAWSIGSGQLDHGQNGQVERSIAEVLAGVEPNTRSRKASHSLRFFKEGLPDDKSQRRDGRLSSHLREKLLPGTHSGDPTGENASKNAVLDTQDDRAAAMRSARTCPLPIRTTSESMVSESPQDGVTITRPQLDNTDHLSSAAAAAAAAEAATTVATAAAATAATATAAAAASYQHQHVSDLNSKNDQSRVSTDPASPQRSRGNRQIGPVCVEEAEESGEENISSAVFLPHPGPEESSTLARANGPSSGSITGNKAQSRPDDFHPWLVKANEPEADGNDLDNLGPADKGERDRSWMLPLRAENGQAAADDAVQPDALNTSARSSRPASLYHQDHALEQQLVPKQPLEAIELIPYKHQVGGHTTLWRFSKRAVCKQLNNRENEFYETVEKYHRDLIKFLPRYIGVLNVTFKKQPRRRSTVKRDDAATAEPHPEERMVRDEARPMAETTVPGTPPGPSESGEAQSGPRVISHSLQSSRLPVPTVTFVDNQHILPRNLWRLPPKGASFPGRCKPASISSNSTEIPLSEHPPPARVSRTREREYAVVAQRPRNCWGATMVNKRLRNEVFNDAFLKQAVSLQKHRKDFPRIHAHRTMQQVLRPASSDSVLLKLPHSEAGTSESADKQDSMEHGNRLGPIQNDMGTLRRAPLGSHMPHVPGITSSSAPEAHVSAGTSPAQKRKRRYSGIALQRKSMGVGESGDELSYDEDADEAGYKGDCEEAETRAAESTGHDAPTPDAPSVTPPTVPDPTTELARFSRPINPKEAQTQRDSRVEYFLLMEDLTAGMRRPCIMDLKMGTRQYGVDANPNKQKSQQGKCAQTTSRALGVRVCGLQVWDVESQSYVFKDKYYGRSITGGQEFQDALTRFLYDGVDKGSILRHIPTVLHKLSELKVIIERLRGYRFYAASLLMFYDGDTSEVEYDTALDESTTDVGTDIEEGTRRSRKNKRDIDFKIADFANSVTAGDLAKDRPCPPAHPGEPDRGFLRGLQSLRKYFLQIQRDTRAELGVASSHRHEAHQNDNMVDDDDDDDGDDSYVSE